MKRLSLMFCAVASVAALVAGGATARPGHSGPHGSLITIRHQMRGCHAWSYDGGAYRAALVLKLHPGSMLTFRNVDVMPHRLVQLAGPKAGFQGKRNMNHVGAEVQVAFMHAGVYRFTTRAGEDYMPGIKTIGEDNVLTLKIVVS